MNETPYEKTERLYRALDENQLRAYKAARPCLPSFCEIIEAGEMEVADKYLKPKKAFYVKFIFPGAKGTGFWRGDLPGMSMVDVDDYDLFQQLKEQEQAAHDDN